MFRNYLKIAFRSLKKQPFFTFLNTFGLAIGMAGGLLIGLYIYDELSFDKMFTDADRIYRVNVDIKFGGSETKSAENSCRILPILPPNTFRTPISLSRCPTKNSTSPYRPKQPIRMASPANILDRDR